MLAESGLVLQKMNNARRPKSTEESVAVRWRAGNPEVGQELTRRGGGELKETKQTDITTEARTFHASD